MELGHREGLKQIVRSSESGVRSKEEPSIDRRQEAEIGLRIRRSALRAPQSDRTLDGLEEFSQRLNELRVMGKEEVIRAFNNG
jgi:hypothetical protein